jgi:hypothetical protein
MPKTPASLQDIVEAAIAPVVARFAKTVAKRVAEATAARLAAEVVRAGPRGRVGGAKKARRARVEVTKWVADRRARRVPTFVIEATGLDTKKKIVAKYGEDAVFAKGKPLPPVAAEASAVKARPPVIRKAAGAK